MGQVGSKMRRVGSTDGYTAGGLSHWCPACGKMHAFALDGKNSSGAQWTWDGNVEFPTFRPSMLIRVYGGERGTDVKEICHYILAAGIIDYCGDSTHALSGQSVPLPELPIHLKD